MAEMAGPDCCLVEFGSGSSLKTRVLLDHMGRQLAAYVPVDISLEHLANTAARLRRAYPRLNVVPVCADFTQPIDLPDGRTYGRRRIVYFPGSTIGNFNRDAARRLLRMIARACGEGGGLLIGVDLDKDRQTLERAYDDSLGVTAAFNLNLLRRINRELDGDFRLNRFRHRAHYNAQAGRIEMHLISLANQRVSIGGEEIPFARDETIHTESSHKYSLEGFRSLAESAGMVVRRVWTDSRQWFSVQYLEVA
jgi:dimethylhistidine N-methyltransferase